MTRDVRRAGWTYGWVVGAAACALAACNAAPGSNVPTTNAQGAVRSVVE